jgi:hypothetical protein
MQSTVWKCEMGAKYYMRKREGKHHLAHLDVDGRILSKQKIISG